jgi:hypothetical protein
LSINYIGLVKDELVFSISALFLAILGYITIPAGIDTIAVPRK